MCVVSDGLDARMGSFSAAWEHFAPWKTVDGRQVVTDRPALEVLVRGVFEPARFLDLVRSFIAATATAEHLPLYTRNADATSGRSATSSRWWPSEG